MTSIFRRLIGNFSRPFQSGSLGAEPAEICGLETESLEPRMLFSAAPVDVAPDDGEVDGPEQVADESVTESDSAQEGSVADPTQSSSMNSEAGLPEISGSSEIDATQEVILVDLDSATSRLNREALGVIADAAADRWRTTGLNDDQAAALDAIEYEIADLGGHFLGATNGSSISIDDDGAGRGWFLDSTPDQDEEFGSASNAPEGIDLLSVILHEQGHILGLDGANGSSDVMNGLIDEGERRLPAVGQADGAVAGSLEGIHHATAPTNFGFTLDQATIAENQSASLTGSFTLGSDQTNVITIDWGDGTIEEQLLTGGANTFAGTHQYLDNGNFSVSVSLSSGTLGQGLAGHWNFDDSTANDQTDFGNNGTGGTFGTDTPFGSGMAFTDGYITIPHSASLATLDDQITISYWSKIDPSGPNWDRTVTKQTSGVGFHAGRFSGTGDTNIRVDSLSDGVEFVDWQNNQNILYSPDDGTLDNSWHHVVFTLDNGVAMQYVDGTLIQTQSYKPGDGLSNTGNLQLGDASLLGALDDVALWSRVLSEAEITQVFGSAIEVHQVSASASLQVTDVAPVIETLQVTPNSATPNDVMLQVDFTDPGSLDEHLAVIDWGDGGSTTEVLLATGARTLQSSHTYASAASHTVNVTIIDSLGDAVGIWSFEGDATDSSGNGNDGTGGSYSSDVASAFGTGQSHDGTGSAVAIANSTTLESVDDEMTLSFWLKADATGANAENNWFRVIRKGTEAPGTTSWMVTRNAGTDETLIRTDTVGGAHNQNRHTGAGPVLDGQWHHVAYVLENGSTREYVDGVLTSESTYSHGDGLSNTEPLTLGTQLNKGLLDEVILYDRALTSLQVGALAGAMDVAAAQDSASVDATGGSVSISDTSGVNNNYLLALDSDGSGSGPEYVITDSTTGLNTRVLASTVTGEITFTGSDGDDTLTIDETAADSGLTINFDGQGNSSTDPGDQIVIGTAGGGGSVNTATYTYTNDHDGTIELTTGTGNNATTTTINYTGLEPITDNMDATNRVLDFTGLAETITVTDNGGTITVDSTEGETTTFNQPTGSLTITGASDDSVGFSNALSLSGANLTVDAGSITVSNAIDGQGGNISLIADSSTTRGIHVTAAISTAQSGTIRLDGTGAGAAGQEGVLVEANLTTAVGDIRIDGTSSGAHGVSVAAGVTISAGEGRILIDGSGGDNVSTFAVNTAAGSAITANDGPISIDSTGSAALGGTIDSGVYLLTVTSTSNIHLDATLTGGSIELMADNDVNLTAATSISKSAAGDFVLLAQNFENFSPGSTGAGASGIPLGEGWINAGFPAGAESLDFVSDLNGTPSGGTGPGADHTFGDATGTYLFLETSGTVDQGEFAHLISPEIDLTGQTNSSVEFYYHMYSNAAGTMGDLTVQGSADGGATWSGDLLTVSGNQGNQWNQALIDLSQFDGDAQFQLRITGVKGTDYRGDIALDDFRFFADGGDLLVEDFESFGQGPTSNPRPRQVLPAASGWTNEVSDPDFKLDWSPIRGNTPSGNTGASNDHTLGNSNGTYLYIETSDSVLEDETATLLSPNIDLSDQSTASAEFFYHMWGVDPEMGELKVYGSADGGATWSTELLTISGNQGNTWHQATVNLDAFAGSAQFVLRVDGIAGEVDALAATGTGYRSDISIDDFRILGDPVADTEIKIIADADGDADGAGGALTMADGAVVNAGNGTVTIGADENITVGSVQTGGTITATSTSGAIVDAGDAGVDFGGGGKLVAIAAAGVGESANQLETVVTNLEAASSNGGVFVANTGDLIIGGIGAAAGVSASSAGVDIDVVGTLNIQEDVTSAGAANLAGTVDVNLDPSITIQGVMADVSANNDVNFGANSQINVSGQATLLEENFDGFPTGSTGPGATGIALAGGWTNVQGSDQLDWSPRAGKTPSGGAWDVGPQSGDHTSGSGKYLYIESSDPVGDNRAATLLSPTIDLSAYSASSVEFYYHMLSLDNSGNPFVGDNGNPQMGTLEVYGSTDEGATWSSVLFSVSENQGDQWHQAVVDLSAFAGSAEFVLRIDGITGDVSGGGAGGFASDIAIDDFKVTGVPANAVTVTADADGDASGSGGSVTMNSGSAIVATGGTVSLNADGNLIVNSITTTGAVAITSGNGTIQDRGETPDVTGGTVTLNGNITPGLASTGTLEVDGNLEVASDDTLTFEVISVADHDQIRVNGEIDLTDAELVIEMDAGYTPMAGDQIILITNDGTEAVTGTFSGLAEGTIVSFDLGGVANALFSITYQGGTLNNDVVLEALGVRATTDIMIDGSGNLVINDIDETIPGGGTTGDSTDNWTISVDGSEVVVTSNGAVGTLINGATQTSLNEARFDVGLFTGNVIVNGLSGDDDFTIGDLGNMVLPGGIEVNGGDGFDHILYTGDGSVLASGGNATFNGEEIDFLLSDLTTTDGNIVLNGTGGGGTNFVGVDLLGSDLTAGGTGTISITGQGGGGTGNYKQGIQITNGSNLTTNNGDITLNGVGGNNGGAFNQGVQLVGSGAAGSAGRTTISAGDSGNLTINGVGGDGSSNNAGVFSNGVDFSVEGGELSLNGTGGAGTSLGNRGVQMANSALTAGDFMGTAGSVAIDGTGNGTGSHNTGILLTTVTATTTSGDITLSGVGSTAGTSYNQGIKLAGSSFTSDSGNIEIDGTGNGTGLYNTGVALSVATVKTGGAGTASIEGTGGSGNYYNEGVQIASKSVVETLNGGLTLSGTGMGSVLGNRGINIGGGSTIQSTGTGLVSLTGVGSTSSSSVYNTGILIGSSTVKSGSGGLTMLGTGGSGSSLNQGIRITSSTINTTGTLTMTGSSAATSGTSNNGIYMLGGTLDGGSGSTLTGTGGGGINNQSSYILNVGTSTLGVSNFSPGGGGPDTDDDPFIRFI